MKKFVFLLLVLALAGGGIYYYLEHRKAQKLASVLIAVIDTGLDLSKIPAEPKLKLAVNRTEIPGNSVDDDRNGKSDDVSGWNFFDANADVHDEVDHGTQVIRKIVAECPGCQILPLKITQSGAGIRPEDVTSAILYALEQGARVVNLSFGITEGSDELKAVVAKAARDGVVLVAAAGVGVPNPFNSVPLSKVYPQAYSDLIVVGSARDAGRADLVINHGPEMDLVLVQKVDSDSTEKRGSSFAAATVSGVIGRFLFENGGFTPIEVRAAVREATLQPDVFDLDRFGFGIFDSRLIGDGDVAETDYHVYGEGEEHRVVDFSSAEEIRGLRATAKCAGREGEPLPEEKISTEPLSKGRARLGVEAPAGQECKVSVKLEFEGGITEELDISL